MVIDTDGSAFITKAEFDSLKNNFQAQIDSYNSSIDSKIDGAIASYLSGITLASTLQLITNFENTGKNSVKFCRSMADLGGAGAFWWDTDNRGIWYGSRNNTQGTYIAAVDYDWDNDEIALSNMGNYYIPCIHTNSTGTRTLFEIRQSTTALQIVTGTSFQNYVETAGGWKEIMSNKSNVLSVFDTVMQSRGVSNPPGWMFAFLFVHLKEVGDGVLIPEKWATGGQGNNTNYWSVFNPEGQPDRNNPITNGGTTKSDTYAGLEKWTDKKLELAEPYAEVGDHFSKKDFWEQRDRWYYMNVDGSTRIDKAGSLIQTVYGDNPVTTLSGVSKISVNKPIGDITEYWTFGNNWNIKEESLPCSGYPNLFGQIESGEGEIIEVNETPNIFTDMPPLRLYTVHWHAHLGEVWSSQYLWNEFGLAGRPHYGFPLCTVGDKGAVTFKVHTGTDASDACYFAVRKNDPFTRKKDGLDNSNVWNTDSENAPIALNSDTEKTITFNVDQGDKIWIKCWPQNAGTISQLYWDGGELTKEN